MGPTEWHPDWDEDRTIIISWDGIHVCPECGIEYPCLFPDEHTEKPWPCMDHKDKAWWDDPEAVE